MSNQMRIKVVNEHVLTESVLNAVDFNNVLNSVSHNSYRVTETFTWTATDDGFITVNNSQGCDAIIKINGNQVNQAGTQDVVWFPFKKGDTIFGSDWYTPTFKMYGVRR